MPKLLRHVGRLNSTDTKCVIVMMQIPGKEDHALIAETDSMPDHYEQQVMELLESPSGQEAEIFAEVLGRKQMFIEGWGNTTVMAALHNAKLLRAISVDEVSMVPQPGVAYSLKEILIANGKITEDPNAEMVPITPDNDPNAATKFNPILHNLNVSSSEEMKASAQGKIAQGQMLVDEGMRIMEQGYQMYDGLRPRLQQTKQIKHTKQTQQTQQTQVKPKRTRKKATTPKKRGRPRKAKANA